MTTAAAASANPHRHRHLFFLLLLLLITLDCDHIAFVTAFAMLQYIVIVRRLVIK